MHAALQEPSNNAETITADALAVDAVGLMERNSITCLIVVDEQNKPVGAVHMHDLLKAGVV